MGSSPVSVWSIPPPFVRGVCSQQQLYDMPHVCTYYHTLPAVFRTLNIARTDLPPFCVRFINSYYSLWQYSSPCLYCAYTVRWLVELANPIHCINYKHWRYRDKYIHFGLFCRLPQTQSPALRLDKQVSHSTNEVPLLLCNKNFTTSQFQVCQKSLHTSQRIPHFNQFGFMPCVSASCVSVQPLSGCVFMSECGSFSLLRDAGLFVTQSSEICFCACAQTSMRPQDCLFGQ